MKVKNRKSLYMLLLIGVTVIVYFLWLFLRPVGIIAVHYRGSGFSDVLVNNFPFTDKGKINWWLKNKKLLREEYLAPAPDKNGNFYLTFWLFGDGYKETDGYDNLCFNDMLPPINCIEKKRVFSVSSGKNRGMSFTTHHAIYRMKESGKIVKDKE